MLVSRGDQVLVIDDLSNGYEANKNPKAKYFKADVFHSELALPSLKGLDLVYHLACHPRSISFQNPLRDMQVNYASTLNLCRLAVTYKFGIVFSSNSGLLGPPLYLPYTEKHPVHPLTVYDCNKIASEYLLRLYGENFGVRSYIFRFASVYGPRQRPNPKLGWLPLIPTWIQALRKHEQVTVEGDGKQTRDFIYVSDVVQALVQAGDVLKYAEGSVGPFLLASSKETQIWELLQKLSDLIPTHSTVIQKPEKLGDIRRMAYDTTAIQLALNWRPETSLDEGLSKTVAWWTQHG